MFLNSLLHTKPLPEEWHFRCKVFVSDDEVVVNGTRVAVVRRRRPVLVEVGHSETETIISYFLHKSYMRCKFKTYNDLLYLAHGF